MRRTWIVGACLMAMFAVGALSPTGASALPTYKACKKAEQVDKKYTGVYTNSACTNEATAMQKSQGKHNKWEFGEWNEGKEAAPRYTVKLEGRTEFRFEGDGFGEVGRMECEKGAGTGEITGPQTATETLSLERCVVVAFNERCSSPGSFDVNTAPLNTELAPSGEGVAIRLTASPIVSEISCGPYPIKMTGTFDTGVSQGVDRPLKSFVESVAAGQPPLVEGDQLLSEVNYSGPDVTSVGARLVQKLHESIEIET